MALHVLQTGWQVADSRGDFFIGQSAIDTTTSPAYNLKYLWPMSVAGLNRIFFQVYPFLFIFFSILLDYHSVIPGDVWCCLVEFQLVDWF